MARLVIIVLAAVVLAVAGLASAQTPVPATPTGGGDVHRGDTASEAAAAALPAFGPTASDDQIGTAEDDGDTALAPDEATATAASVGGDVPPGAFAPSPSDSPNGASAVEFAGVSTVVAIAGYLFF